MNSTYSFIVIPARLKSTRLPRKMLLNETGKSLVQHTYESAHQASKPMGLCVAADDAEVEAEVRRFGGNVLLTDPNAASGTDRVAEVAANMRHVNIFVNVQGDEPEIEPDAIDDVIRLLELNTEADVATLATPIRSRATLENPSCVKVVCAADGRALYFSRSPIPHPRAWSDDLLTQDPPVFLLHMGIYAYRREFLLKFPALPRAMAEDVEKLEQLRILAAGHAIQVGLRDQAPSGIDTPEEYGAFVSRARQR